MNYLNTINSPKNLKTMPHEHLRGLAKEIRHFLVRSISKTGGHLAPNLGVVELAIALHYCLDTPNDRIVWDVGHQSYVHKLLTGRRDEFVQLRKFGGMSGFPKASESPYDSFDTGHSSTSISAAYGLAVSRDLLGQSHKVVAVIGDGSMSGGLAYEGLNNVGRSKSNMMIILNDNQMSISKNVGALSKYLNNLRVNESYNDAKKEVRRLLKGVPVAGKPTKRFITKAKARLKYMLLPGALFEHMGFKYYGPVDGNNLHAMIDLLQKVKQIEGPVLIHVRTKKGKGYAPAEAEPAMFHGVEPFHPATGKLKAEPKTTYSDIFGKKMISLGHANKKIAAITASMPNGTGLAGFAQVFPKQFFDVGIAESHAVTFAAGLAKNGLIPVVAIYSSFLQRAYDQILHDVCIQNLPVVFAIDRAGFVGGDGETHQGLFDLSYLAHMPNMTILAPANAQELEAMLEFAVNLGSPCAVRYPREAADFKALAKPTPIEFGKWNVLEDGEDIAILPIGAMSAVGREVFEMLKNEGLRPTLINPRFVKPINAACAVLLRNYRHVFVLEENVTAGGFGSMLRDALTAQKIYIPIVHSFAAPDKFIPQGSRAELLQMLGLSAPSIYDRITEILNYDTP